MPSAFPLLCEGFIQQLLRSKLCTSTWQVSTQAIQECSPADGKAEAPERLRHSRNVTQHAKAEMGSAFLADTLQGVSAEILKQLFGL